MEEQDSNTLIQTKIDELGELYTRMDARAKLLNLEPYQMKGFGPNPKLLNNVMNVTSNRPAAIITNLVADLMSGKWQDVVEGVSQRQQHYIESFAHNCFDQIDDRLIIQGGYSLDDWLSNHVCHRSLIGARFVTTIEKDKFSIDCLQLDMRWCPFEFDKEGLAWAAPRTFRTGRDVLDEYEKKEGFINPGLTGLEKDLEIRDFWDKKKNEVLCGGKAILKYPNPFGEVPIAIILPATGFMMRDTGYMKYESQDALFLNANLFETENQNLSIKQTLGFESIKPPYVQEVETMDAAPADKPPSLNETMKAKIGQGWKLLERGDVNRAFQMSDQTIEALLQMGAPTNAELGDASLNRPEVWVRTQMELRGKALGPRRKALERFRQRAIRMLINQYLTLSKATGKETVEIGKTGSKRKYSVQQLGDPANYSISCKLKAQSKAQDIANLAQAQAEKAQGLPTKYILTHTLEVEDPDGVMREMALEQARLQNPAIAIMDQVKYYIQEAEDIQDETEANIKILEAQQLFETAANIMRQQAMANVPQLQPPTLPKGNTNPLAALIAQGGGGKGGGQERPNPQGGI